MRIVNVEPGGATVFITDLGVRIGRDSIPVHCTRAASSTDLRRALDGGLVRLEIDSIEKGNPLVDNLMRFARAADAKKEGEALFARIESAMKGESSISPEMPIRSAVFEPVL